MKAWCHFSIQFSVSQAHGPYETRHSGYTQNTNNNNKMLKIFEHENKWKPEVSLFFPQISTEDTLCARHYTSYQGMDWVCGLCPVLG